MIPYFFKTSWSSWSTCKEKVDGQTDKNEKKNGDKSIILERKENLLCVWDVFSSNVIWKGLIFCHLAACCHYQNIKFAELQQGWKGWAQPKNSFVVLNFCCLGFFYFLPENNWQWMVEVCFYLQQKEYKADKKSDATLKGFW